MKEDSKNNKFNDLPNWQFVLMMMAAVVVWAFAFPFIKIGLRELSFINLTIMRFFIVGCVFLLILLLQQKRLTKLQKRDVLPIFLLGILGVMVYHLGLNYGQQFISPGAASLIIATIPIQILILAAIFLKEKIGLIKVLGIIIALSGVLVISIWGKKDASPEIDYIFGAITVLIAAVMAAFYTIAGKKLLERYSGLSLTVYAMLLGSIGLIPLINNSLFEEVTKMSINGWTAIVFLGVFSTVIGYAIWYIALKIKSASEITVYLYLIPVLATIISYFWFKDEVTLMFILGGLLVITGLAIVNLKNREISNKKVD